eukprot:m.46921 g.46921  ORF g.46921 m.46921 type:complete len:52 (-) comp13183_c0_seq2:840-995(-)
MLQCCSSQRARHAAVLLSSKLLVYDILMSCIVDGVLYHGSSRQPYRQSVSS